jgi:Peptidase C13 family
MAMSLRIPPFAFCAAAALVCVAPEAAMAAGFDSWAALVVAGDYRAHSGAESEVFDNGRRDIAKTLQDLGFVQSRILQYSVRPELDKVTNPKRSDAGLIRAEFTRMAKQAGGGCFVYFTSHGGAQGVVVGDEIESPRDLAGMLNDACGDRATVVMISACYSGVFIPVLRSDTRMIVTAARPDRQSFGCGESNMYTFFDQCVLESFPVSPDFPRLAARIQDCVAKREMVEGATPPSEPQVSIGAAVVRTLAQYAFTPAGALSAVSRAAPR